MGSMGSIIVFIIIAYLIKKGMSQGHGLSGVSDVGKIFGTICGIIFVIALISSPVFWILLSLAIVALIVWLVQKNAAGKRSEKYGWNTEEYMKKYSECLQKFKSAMAAEQMERGGYKGMNETQRRAADLANERRARERAKAEAEAYMRSKYGENVKDSEPIDVTARTVDAEPVETYSTSSNTSSTTATRKSKQSAKRQNRDLKSRILPKAVARRTKIIASFNEKYNLYLTDDQIRRIADASYMSVAWKQEVEAMAGKYDAVYEWMTGDTAYLRAYLRAFTVQDVTSDFRQQMQIVMDSFEEVFEFSDSISTLSIDQRIERINSKFMTNFDEITYMIAYRYLETLGLKHHLEKTQLNRVDDTFDDLVSKYDNMSTNSVDKDLESVAPAPKSSV